MQQSEYIHIIYLRSMRTIQKMQPYDVFFQIVVLIKYTYTLAHQHARKKQGYTLVLLRFIYHLLKTISNARTHTHTRHDHLQYVLMYCYGYKHYKQQRSRCCKPSAKAKHTS